MEQKPPGADFWKFIKESAPPRPEPSNAASDFANSIDPIGAPMAFLDLSGPAPTNGTDAPPLPAGIHTVTVEELKYVTKFDKALCVFVDASGAQHKEWISAASEGQKNRMKVFLGHLCKLSGVAPVLVFQSTSDFDALGRAIAGAKVPLALLLKDEEWDGKVSAKIPGKITESISAAPVTNAGVDDGDIPF